MRTLFNGTIEKEEIIYDWVISDYLYNGKEQYQLKIHSRQNDIRYSERLDTPISVSDLMVLIHERIDILNSNRKHKITGRVYDLCSVEYYCSDPYDHGGMKLTLDIKDPELIKAIATYTVKPCIINLQIEEMTV